MKAARLLEQEGRTSTALGQVDEAERLDSTDPEIAAMRAHLQLRLHQQELLQDPAPWNNPLLKQIAGDFQHTLDSLGYLLDNNRQEYATVLFLLGQTSQAIEQGQQLRPNSKEQNALCGTITQLGMRYNRLADANAAVQAIHTPPATSTPAVPAMNSRKSCL